MITVAGVTAVLVGKRQAIAESAWAGSRLGRDIVRDIRASAEVLALIGTESLRELEKGAFGSYECAECGWHGLTTDATSVVVHRYRDIAVVKLAHAWCLHSVIVEFDADAPPGIGSEGDGADMRAMTLVLSYPVEPRIRPLLVLEHRVETARFTPGGERINMTMAAVLGRGLALVSADHEMPDLAEGWQLLRPDRSSALLLVPDGEVAYRGGCDQSDEWARLVDAGGACIVLVGTIGLYAIPDEELTARRVHEMLDEAARAGSLAGGLVPCPPRGPSGSGPELPPADLASKVRRSWGAAGS